MGVYLKPSVFLIIPAIHKATKKPNKDDDINLVVNANAPTLAVPLIMPHFKLLNSALFFNFEYLCASITTEEIVPTGSPCTKLEAKIADAISENSSLCLFFQPKNNAKGPIDEESNSLNSICLISFIHFWGIVYVECSALEIKDVYLSVTRIF